MLRWIRNFRAKRLAERRWPDVLPDDFGHEDEGVHFLLRPYAAVAALLEADMADHVPVAHDVALEERGDGVVED